MFCAACGKNIVEYASFCDNCGSAVTRMSGKVTIKNVYRGKNKQALGMVLVLIAILFGIGAFSEDSSTYWWISGSLAMVGLITYLSGRMEHWYHAE